MANGVLKLLPGYPGRYELAEGAEVARCLRAQGDVELAFDR